MLLCTGRAAVLRGVISGDFQDAVDRYCVLFVYADDNVVFANADTHCVLVTQIFVVT